MYFLAKNSQDKHVLALLGRLALEVAATNQAGLILTRVGIHPFRCISPSPSSHGPQQVECSTSSFKYFMQSVCLYMAFEQIFHVQDVVLHNSHAVKMETPGNRDISTTMLRLFL